MFASKKARLQAIENKLDEILASLAIQDRMLRDILEQIDQRRSDNGMRRQAMQAYVDNVSGILQQKGAAPEFIGAFKNLFEKVKS